MLHVTQSQKIELLVQAIQHYFNQQTIGIFEQHRVVIPSHGVGEWLNFQLASQLGISARIEFGFFGALQRELFIAVLGENNVPKNALLSKQSMQWRIFAYCVEVLAQAELSSNPMLNELLQRLQHYKPEKKQRALWNMAAQIAEVFASYITYRADWLMLWGNGKTLPIPKEKIIQENTPSAKDKQLSSRVEPIPGWLEARYVGMQQWQQFLWQQLFHQDFLNRQAAIDTFWRALDQQPRLRQQLPQSLSIFTVLQLPLADFEFIRRLAGYTDIHIFHFNPSQEYWADVVDPLWLRRQQQKNPAYTAFLESQHPLLTRFAKQARDIFYFLVNLSGNEEGEWRDLFVEEAEPPCLLNKIQQDIFYLKNSEQADWQLDEQDRSLQIHACHSFTRQLEVLREQLIDWFAADSSRKASDVLICVPNLAEVAPLIRAVFELSPDDFYLPINITGLPLPDTELLWQAITDRFCLLNGRFGIDEFLAWLELDAIQQVYSLSREDISRLAQLLTEVGFRRGFDKAHLSKTLDAKDQDDRFTLQYALNRLMLGVVMPVDALHANILSTHLVSRQDFELVATLSTIYKDINEVRGFIELQDKSIQYWVELLEQELMQRFNVMVESAAYRGIMQALEEVRKQMELTLSHDLILPLRFVFDEVFTIVQNALPGSHPTGKITFTRLGTLRPLPYRLIVMMNLDTGVFPSRDFKNTFDLIDVFPARKGDRSRREDDRGAFIDGLLLAKEACWFFYNGFDVKDPHSRQPSGTLQEFMDFIASKLIDADTGFALQKLPVQLWHSHQLQPFDTQYFDGNNPISFKGIWSAIAQQIQQPAAIKHWANQPLQQLNAEKQHVSFRTVLRQLASPAAHYLSALRIRQISKVDSSQIYEPLNLNALQQYQIRALHQQQRGTELQEYKLQDILPVGHAANAFWKKSQLEAIANQKRLMQWGGKENSFTEHVLEIGSFSLTIQVPLSLESLPEEQAATQCSRWVAQYPTSMSEKRQLIFWLQHLAWQAWRNTSVEQVAAKDGERIAVFSKGTLYAAPIEAQQAKAYLLQWLDVWQKAAVQPWVLPPALVLHKTAGIYWDNKEQVASLKNSYLLNDIWLGRDYDFLGRNPKDKEECSLHPDWQMILRGQDASQVLRGFMDQYAIALYQPLKQHVEELKQ